MEGKDVEMTVCNLLANLSKWKREEEGGRKRNDFVLWQEDLTVHLNSGLLEPEARKLEERPTAGLQ